MAEYEKVGWTPDTPLSPKPLDQMDEGTKTANDDADAHIADTDNPHNVTAAQAGALPAGATAVNTNELDGLDSSQIAKRSGDTVTGPVDAAASGRIVTDAAQIDTPGRLIVFDATLQWVDESGDRHASHAPTFIGTPAGARPRSIWVEGQNVHWIADDGTGREFAAPVVPESTGVRSGRAGSIWVEDDYIRWLDDQQIERRHCDNGCEFGCQTGCQTGCETTCETGCQTSCENSCQGSCETGCQTTSETGCETTCELSCQSSCETACQTCGQSGCGTQARIN